MKKTMYILLLIVLVAGIANAQRLINVPSNVIDGLPKAIKADSLARMAALPTQTIYVLERNGYYPCVSVIENTNYFLYIKAASGTGFKPLLVPSPTSGTTYAYNINFRANGKLEGLTLEASRPTGGVNNRYINIYNGASVWIKDCEVVHDRGSAFAVQSDSCSIYIDDCFIHSIGHPKILGGNGRVVDLRAASIVDSVVVRNTTFFNLTDRIIRTMGIKVNYLKFDHNTGLTTEGYHGGLQAGRARELIVTNNIFYNTIALGSYKKRTAAVTPNISEQNQPEKSLMWVVTLDTLYADSKVTVRNNNVWWDQQYKDLWTKWKDSVDAPGIITPTIMKKLGADSTKAFFVEPLTFQAPPPSIYKFIDSALIDPNKLVQPENWLYTYQDSGAMSPINCSYGLTAGSYTKGDGGFPLGDLNWYPAKKAQWLLTSVGKQENSMIPMTAELSQNYPNPFNPSTTIRYAVPQSGQVLVRVHDMLGRTAATVADGIHAAGEYTVSFDAQNLSSGIYFYTLETGSARLTKKMILMR